MLYFCRESLVHPVGLDLEELPVPKDLMVSVDPLERLDLLDPRERKVSNQSELII